MYTRWVVKTYSNRLPYHHFKRRCIVKAYQLAAKWVSIIVVPRIVVLLVQFVGRAEDQSSRVTCN
jgi:hypothetical protein